MTLGRRKRKRRALERQAAKNKKRPYACVDCRARNCKLWREYQTFACFISLKCVDCACKEQKKDARLVQADGRLEIEYVAGYKELTDSIGWLVPAVPCLEEDTYWGYSSVPEERVKWWKALPLRGKK